MSGYDNYYKRDRSSPPSYGPSSADYDPAVALAASHQQQLAMLTSLSSYPGLFGISPHRQRHDSFDDLAGMVHQPIESWGISANPYAAPLPQPPQPQPTLSSVLAFLPEPPQQEAWLHDLKLEVKDISVKALSGSEVLTRLRDKMNDVVTKYIPCVGFLVDCQQSLRKGLERRRITAPQYYRMYVDHLPGEFYRKNVQMDAAVLTEAYNGLLQLRSDAANAQSQGSDAVKSNFLGGMKDGESWGLRKWLSRHGHALHVCTDVECIVAVCRKLDPDILERLSSIIRPTGKTVLHKLKTEIPTSYQAHSTAHPYLPYFHRLEAALRNLSTLGEANDVICLDDSDDDDVQIIVKPSQAKKGARPAAAPARKRKRRIDAFEIEDDDAKPSARSQLDHSEQKAPPQPAVINQDDDASSSGESCGDAVEVIDHCPWPFQPRIAGISHKLTTQVYQLADAWDSNQLVRPPHVHASQFWRGNHYADALRLFGELLDSSNASMLAEPTDDEACVQAGQPAFSHVVKHPIAFRCIVNSLLDRSGSLPDKSLASWNMFDGKDMLQAIDLVLLNSLAYGKIVNSSNRPAVNYLRKVLWNGITQMGPKKTDVPTRRTEASGFVIYRQR